MIKFLLGFIIVLLAICFIGYGFTATLVIFAIVFSALWGLLSYIFYMALIILAVMFFVLVVTGGNRKV